jgi:hypothetical protein
VRALTRRAVADAGELARVAAECASQLEPGLVPVQRPFAAGEVTVDLACADASGRLALVVCDVVAGPETVLRAVEAVAWWGEHAALRPSVLPDAALDRDAAPRALIVASRFSDRALRLLRVLGASAPEAVECRLFQDADGPVVGLGRLDLAQGAGPPRPAAAVEVTAAEALRAPSKEAAVLIQRLERLRFSEGFR